jgi:Glyoxalase/Bleomycin resistance protein/Dioxygenase superfamily
MRLLGYLVVVHALAVGGFAELPGFYKTVNRVTWVVQNIDHAKPAWIALGLADVHEYPDIKLIGKYRGRPVTIWAWEITGHLGNLTVDMIQLAEGQRNALTDFLDKHGDGIFSIVHEVATQEALEKEIRRMHNLGIGVLQQVSLDRQGKHVTFTYFDSEPEGKFVLGLVYWPGGAPAPEAPETISHLAPVVRESQTVSAFWERLGFPAFRVEHATPRGDSGYRGKPFLLSFDVGNQHYDQFGYEWIVPPMAPPNIYADFLKLHGEGIQHLGMPVDDLKKATAEYEKLGYHVWQSGAWGDIGKKGSGQYDYMDTDSIGGVSVELIHAH